MLSQSWAPYSAPGKALPWQPLAEPKLGRTGLSQNQRITNLSSGRSSKAARSPRPSSAPLASPGPQAGWEPGSPGTPCGIASCLQAAPEGQPGLGSAVSQPLRLPLIHFTLSILIGSALSPAPPSLARPPPRRLLHRWAARAACCMIHTNSLTQGNQWARKSTRSKARSLSGDRPHNKETQRAAACTPPAPGAPRGTQGTRRPPLPPPPQPLRAPVPCGMG